MNEMYESSEQPVIDRTITMKTESNKKPLFLYTSVTKNNSK